MADGRLVSKGFDDEGSALDRALDRAHHRGPREVADKWPRLRSARRQKVAKSEATDPMEAPPRQTKRRRSQRVGADCARLIWLAIKSRRLNCNLLHRSWRGRGQIDLDFEPPTCCPRPVFDNYERASRALRLISASRLSVSRPIQQVVAAAANIPPAASPASFWLSRNDLKLCFHLMPPLGHLLPESRPGGSFGRLFAHLAASPWAARWPPAPSPESSTGRSRTMA